MVSRERQDFFAGGTIAVFNRWGGNRYRCRCLVKAVTVIKGIFDLFSGYAAVLSQVGSIRRRWSRIFKIFREAYICSNSSEHRCGNI